MQTHAPIMAIKLPTRPELQFDAFEIATGMREASKKHRNKVVVPIFYKVARHNLPLTGFLLLYVSEELGYLVKVSS